MGIKRFGERVAIATAFLITGILLGVVMSYITDVINYLWWGIE